jgi:hypothetical protein
LQGDLVFGAAPPSSRVVGRVAALRVIGSEERRG